MPLVCTIPRCLKFGQRLQQFLIIPYVMPAPLQLPTFPLHQGPSAIASNPGNQGCMECETAAVQDVSIAFWGADLPQTCCDIGIWLKPADFMWLGGGTLPAARCTTNFPSSRLQYSRTQFLAISRRITTNCKLKAEYMRGKNYKLLLLWNLACASVSHSDRAFEISPVALLLAREDI